MLNLLVRLVSRISNEVSNGASPNITGGLVAGSGGLDERRGC